METISAKLDRLPGSRRRLDISEIVQRAKALEDAMIAYASNLTRDDDMGHALRKAKLATRLLREVEAEEEKARLRALEGQAWGYLVGIVTGEEEALRAISANAAMSADGN